MNNILVDSKYENLRDTEQMGRFIQPSILALESILKSYFFFHLFFIILIATEILALSFFFTFLSKSYLLAIALAGLFLTIFSYFISQIYFRAKKEISLLTCLDDYAKECQGTMDYEEGHPASHIFLSQAYGRLADHLQGKEYYIIKYGTSLPNLRPLLEKFSCWLYWHDLFFIKELLLKKNIEENIKLIKSEPISVESHIALANAYVMLTGLYIDPRKLKNQEIERWIPSNVFDENMKNQFQTAAKKAIEEFYGVTVTDVNTSVVPAKAKSRMTKSGVLSGRKPAKKKAVVTVAEGEEINLYGEI